MELWHLWAVGGLALLVSEMFSGDFWLTCLAIGCGAAAAVGLTPLGLPFQLGAFAAGTVVSLGLLRPALLKRLRVGHDVIRTNVEALPGKSGVVTEVIEAGRTGRALVDGEDWRVVSADGGALPAGTRVFVLSVDGSTLVVEKEGTP